MSAVTSIDTDRGTPEPGPSEPDQRVHLGGATWSDYERLLALRGERSVPRITYVEGELELMTPSVHHERVAAMLSWLLGVWALERDLALQALRTATWRRRAVARGAEADGSFVLGDADKPWPDLVVEVVVTGGGIDKLDVWRALQVPEVWIWQRGVLTAHVLEGSRGYVASAQSRLLPDVDLAWLGRLAQQTDRTWAAKLLLRVMRWRRPEPTDR